MTNSWLSERGGGVDTGWEMERDGKGQDTSRGLSNLALLLLSPHPVYLPELFERSSVCTQVWGKGGVGRVEKGDCHCYASFLWDNLHAKGVQKAHRTSTTGSSGVFSHTVQICIASSGSLCQCASCCQPLTLEGRCPNCLPRNSVPTLNAAVSSPTTDWFLPLVTAEQKLCVFL